MATITPRGPERRSGAERRVADVVPAVFGERERRSGEERRSGKDRRRNIDELEERWDQLLEAVRTEFWRLPQDPDAVFEPRRDELKLRARIDAILGARASVDASAGLSFSQVGVELVAQPHGRALKSHQLTTPHLRARNKGKTVRSIHRSTRGQRRL